MILAGLLGKGAGVDAVASQKLRVGKQLHAEKQLPVEKRLAAFRLRHGWVRRSARHIAKDDRGADLRLARG
jgi:hypothetical protein